MDVGTGGSARLSNRRNSLSTFDHGTERDEVLSIVAVVRFITVRMLQDHQIAIAAAGAVKHHASRCGGADHSTFRCREINAVVLFFRPVNGMLPQAKGRRQTPVHWHSK